MRGSASVVPGRATLRAAVMAQDGLSRDQFLARRKQPFLLQLNEEPGKDEPTDRKPSVFETVVPGALSAGATSTLALYVYEVAKRPGANAFSFMTTLGRTATNDIVVPSPSVSKFHASFKQDPGGAWVITDSSSGGVWLDGRQVPHDVPQALRSGSRVSLARTVELLFLLPPEAWDYLSSARKRLGL